MDTYLLKGHYQETEGFKGSNGRLIGKIEIEQDGTFEGEVFDLKYETSQNCIIQGFIFNDNNLEKLLFLKFPCITTLSNIVYALTKPSTYAVEGIYEGYRKVLAHSTRFNPNAELFITELGNPFDSDAASDITGGIVTLTLHKTR